MIKGIIGIVNILTVLSLFINVPIFISEFNFNSRAGFCVGWASCLIIWWVENWLKTKDNEKLQE